MGEEITRQDVDALLAMANLRLAVARELLDRSPNNVEARWNLEQARRELDLASRARRFGGTPLRYSYKSSAMSAAATMSNSAGSGARARQRTHSK